MSDLRTAAQAVIDSYDLYDSGATARDLLHQLRAALAQPDGWQPIETAPRDGTEFQAWVVRDDNGIGFWESKCKYDKHGTFSLWGRVDYDEDGWDSSYRWSTPTHWMPSPAPPGERP